MLMFFCGGMTAKGTQIFTLAAVKTISAFNLADVFN
jgi:hypothetical protein